MRFFHSTKLKKTLNLYKKATEDLHTSYYNGSAEDKRSSEESGSMSDSVERLTREDKSKSKGKSHLKSSSKSRNKNREKSKNRSRDMSENQSRSDIQSRDKSRSESQSRENSKNKSKGRSSAADESLSGEGSHAEGEIRSIGPPDKDAPSDMQNSDDKNAPLKYNENLEDSDSDGYHKFDSMLRGVVTDTKASIKSSDKVRDFQPLEGDSESSSAKESKSKEESKDSTNTQKEDSRDVRNVDSKLNSNEQVEDSRQRRYAHVLYSS